MYNNIFFSNKKKIIFYHFQYFRIFLRIFCLPGLYPYRVNKNQIINKIYKNYFSIVRENIYNYKLNYPLINRSLISHFIKSILKFDFKIYF